MAEALEGFARLFRPTYAGANMGHPDWSAWSCTVHSAPNLPQTSHLLGMTNSFG